MNTGHSATIQGAPGNAVLAPRRPSARAWLAAGLVLAVAAAFIAGRGAAAHTGDAELAMLLRLMGVIKLAMAAAAAGLVAWRLGSPMAPSARAVAVASCWCLAAGAVLVASLAHMLIAAALFHAGLLALIVLALPDTRRAGP